MSAILRKSLTDLTRRRARAFFTVLTLALAVASVGIFAVPGLMQQSMDREIAANKLADVTLQTKPLELSDAQLQRLRALPNVEAVGAKSLFSTRIYVGARRQRAMVIGVPDFARQDADVVTPLAGSAPAAGTVLTDNQNAPKGKFEGTTVRVVAADGSVQALPVSGEGAQPVRRLAGRDGGLRDVLHVAGDGGGAQRQPRLQLARPATARRRAPPPPTARWPPCATSCAATRASTGSPSCPRCASPASTRARRCSSRSRAS